MNYLKSKLGFEEGEDHLIQEAIETGNHNRRKIKWIWGKLPTKS